MREPLDYIGDVDAGHCVRWHIPGVGNLPVSRVNQTRCRVGDGIRLHDGGCRLMLDGVDEARTVAAVIAQPVDVDLVVRVARLVVDLEIDFAANIRTHAGGEALDRR